MAYEILDGFGDVNLGEWTERGELAFHLRRRLSLQEQKLVGEAIDLRNSEEGVVRLAKANLWMPRQFLPMAAGELGKP